MQDLQSCSEHAYSRNDKNNNGLRNNFITWKKVVVVVIVLISLMILLIKYLYFYHFGAKLVSKKFHTHV